MPRWPVDGAPRIASPYGDPRRVPGYPGYPKYGPGPHWGVDLAGSLYQVVRAPERMTVVDTAVMPGPTSTGLPAPWTGYGPGIVVGHGASGAYHLLAHLAVVDVVRNQILEEGAQLGLMGNPGGSGAHTHWEVRDVAVDDGPATRERHTTDPHIWLDVHGGADPVPLPSMSGWVWLGLLWAVSRAR